MSRHVKDPEAQRLAGVLAEAAPSSTSRVSPIGARRPRLCWLADRGIQTQPEEIQHHPSPDWTKLSVNPIRT